MGPLVVFGDGSFHHAWADSGAARREWAGQHDVSYPTDRVDDGLGAHTGGLDDLVACGAEHTLATIGVGHVGGGLLLGVASRGVPRPRHGADQADTPGAMTDDFRMLEGVVPTARLLL